MNNMNSVPDKTYCRIEAGSSVHVAHEREHGYSCLKCSLHREVGVSEPGTRSTVTKCPLEMVAHLKQHEAAGHAVPRDLKERLLIEMQESVHARTVPEGLVVVYAHKPSILLTGAAREDHVTAVVCCTLSAGVLPRTLMLEGKKLVPLRAPAPPGAGINVWLYRPRVLPTEEGAYHARADLMKGSLFAGAVQGFDMSQIADRWLLGEENWLGYAKRVYALQAEVDGL